MYDAGNPKLVLCDNLEGWGEEEGGKGFRMGGTHVCLWLIHVDIWQKPSLYFKVIILQLKIKLKRRGRRGKKLRREKYPLIRMDFLKILTSMPKIQTRKRRFKPRKNSQGNDSLFHKFYVSSS